MHATGDQPQDDAHARYRRQMLLPGIGREGQEKLSKSRVMLVGCGALGSVIADQLVRSGVGYLRIIDRDWVELTNLQRQVLFDEEDARQGLPKAIAAFDRLRRVNSAVKIDPHVADVHAGNVEEFAEGMDLLLDGTDNAETRYLVNDLAVKKRVPWVYGACTGTEGRVMAVKPGAGPCLRCVFSEAPAPGELPTCDTAGVLGPAASAVASLQVIAAIKVLLGDANEFTLTTIDFWANRFRTIDLSEARRTDCVCCGRRAFAFLDAVGGGATTQLCGRNAVQVRGQGKVDLAVLAGRLEAVGRVERGTYFLKCWPREGRGMQLTVFPDGRTIVHGVNDPALARSITARYVGI